MSSTRTASRRRTYTEEELEQFAAARRQRRGELDALADGCLAALPHQAAWSALMAAAAVHHSRGTVNCMLLAVQAPGALDAESLPGWRALGRKVRKGEHGHRIYTSVKSKPKGEGSGGAEPQTPERATPTEEGTAARDGGRLRGFSTGSVFTLEQTDPVTVEGAAYQPMPAYPTGSAEAAAAVRRLLERQTFRVEARTGWNHAVTVDSREEGEHGEWVLPVDAADADAPATTAALLAVAARLYGDDLQDAEDGLPIGQFADALAESAAHVAARMLGLSDPGPAPVPELGEWADLMDSDPRNPLIKRLAAAAVATGRRLAADVAAEAPRG
jgi:hypothetical protein